MGFHVFLFVLFCFVFVLFFFCAEICELVEWNGDLGSEILGMVCMSIPGTKGTVDLWAVD